MIAQTLTPQLATTASMLVRLAQPDNLSLHRALSKAEGRLMVQPWRVDSGMLAIASVSCPNDVRLTDGETCDCPTSKGVCWHIGAWHILCALSAAGAHVLAPLPLPVHIDEDDLPAESFLDGPFDAFEDTTLLGPVENPYFEEVVGLPVFAKRGATPATVIPFKAGPSRVHANPLDASVDELVAA